MAGRSLSLHQGGLSPMRPSSVIAGPIGGALVRTLLVVALLGLTAGCASMNEPLKTVPHVELPRYMGDWYVIANIPYFAERDCYDSVESYALRDDGNIDNWFTCRKKSFDAPMKRLINARAKVKDQQSNAVWSVTFFKIIAISYLIIDLDPDYNWVVVGHPSRRYGWIMSRAKSLPDPVYQQILQRLQQQGYDPGKFQKVPQREAAAVDARQ
jgi:apolipoprotein D and lipocalin family protein